MEKEKAKPITKTPVGFSELVRDELGKRGIWRRVDAAKRLHATPLLVGKILNHKFPGEIKEKGLLPTPSRQERAAISVVARICVVLDLDLQACLEACGLLADEFAMALGREAVFRNPILDSADMEMLVRHVKERGTLDYKSIPGLVYESRKARSSHG